MSDTKIKLPIIVGATASGKSALALRIATEYNGEIVSCDSMQIYRGMDIGTAKPTAEEQAAVPHHMIDIVDPWESFSCADYALAAEKVIADIISRGKLPIVCGGTGLYLDALLRGGLNEEADSDEDYRRELTSLATEKGNEYIHALLTEIDPESAEAIHPNNLKRVIRALEVYKVTGKPKSVLDREKSDLSAKYEPLAVCLWYNDREVLYDRINQRVDLMVSGGLVDEVRRLDEEKIFERSTTAAGAIGYKELLGYIRGELPYNVSVETLKMATRRYAKRQMTWFGSKPYINKLFVDRMDNGEFEKIIKNAEKVFQLSK